MTFHEHGSHSIEAHNNILKIKASDGWNYEQAIYFSRECKSVIQSDFSGKKWATLVILENWLPTADAIAPIKDTTLFGIENGLVVEAIVSNCSLSTNLMLDRMLPASNSRFLRQAFPTVKGAQEWIERSLC